MHSKSSHKTLKRFIVIQFFRGFLLTRRGWLFEHEIMEIQFVCSICENKKTNIGKWKSFGDFDFDLKTFWISTVFESWHYSVLLMFLSFAHFHKKFLPFLLAKNDSVNCQKSLYSPYNITYIYILKKETKSPFGKCQFP